MAEEPSESVGEERIDPLTLFSENIQLPVEGLMYLGQYSESIEFCGHTFGLRTLLPQDRFAIAVAMQPYRNTIMEVDAFQAAHIAMALTEIDHDKDFCPPVGPGIDATARGRLNWVSKNLFPPVVDYLWVEYQRIEAQALLALQELDHLSKGNQPTTLPPWLDSLIGAGISADETPADTPDSTTSNSD